MVEGVRLLRIVGLYKTSLYINVDTVVEGRSPHWISWDALYSFWALALLSIAGAFALRRRAHAPPLYPLLAPIVVVLVTVVVTYASTRFRTTAEPSLVVLAALAIDALEAAIVRLRSNYASARN